VTAHSHARTPGGAATAKLGGIGYHPSLLPRHRDAVVNGPREGDPIAGGPPVYHWPISHDAGAIAAQSGFSQKGETARELWTRRAGALRSEALGEVIDYAKTTQKPCRRSPRTSNLRPCPRSFGSNLIPTAAIRPLNRRYWTVWTDFPFPVRNRI